MIFKLWFVITKAQLFMHYDYFEWAPCIETFGFFSKCAQVNCHIIGLTTPLQMTHKFL